MRGDLAAPALAALVRALVAAHPAAAATAVVMTQRNEGKRDVDSKDAVAMAELPQQRLQDVGLEVAPRPCGDAGGSTKDGQGSAAEGGPPPCDVALVLGAHTGKNMQCADEAGAARCENANRQEWEQVQLTRLPGGDYLVGSLRNTRNLQCRPDGSVGFTGAGSREYAVARLGAAPLPPPAPSTWASPPQLGSVLGSWV